MLNVLLPQLILDVDRKLLHFPNLTLVRGFLQMHLLYVRLKAWNFKSKIFTRDLRLAKVRIIMADLTLWFYRCEWLQSLTLFVLGFYFTCMVSCPLVLNWLNLFAVIFEQFCLFISVLLNCSVHTKLVILSQLCKLGFFKSKLLLQRCYLAFLRIVLCQKCLVFIFKLQNHLGMLDLNSFPFIPHPSQTSLMCFYLSTDLGY